MQRSPWIGIAAGSVGDESEQAATTKAKMGNEVSLFMS